MELDMALSDLSEVMHMLDWRCHSFTAKSALEAIASCICDGPEEIELAITRDRN